MCDCYSTVKAKLVEHFKAKQPEGSTPIDLTLEGYVFGFGEGVSHCSSNSVRVAYQTPKKVGGMKKVVIKSFVRASFCPFCGEKCE